MHTATLLTALAVGLLALGASARPAQKTSLRLKDALKLLKIKENELAKSFSGASGSGDSSSESSDKSSSESSDSSGSESSDSSSGDSSDSSSSESSEEWDWDFEDWMDYVRDACGMQDDWPHTHGGALTPDMLRAELEDFSEFLGEATSAVVTHRDSANHVSDLMATVDVSDDAAFAEVVGAHAQLFNAFSESLDGLGHGAMCTMVRLNHIKNRFDFEGAEGFAEDDGACSAAHNLVKASADLVASVSDRSFMLDFGAAMRADIACAADEFEDFSGKIASGLAAASGDMSGLTRRDVAKMIMGVEFFMETSGREIYEFSDAVRRVGKVLEELYGEADKRVVNMKAAELRASKMTSMMDLVRKALSEIM